MTWAIPEYSKRQVNFAGRSLIDNPRDNAALDILNNWRASHSFPLNTIQAGLRENARAFRGAYVVQRLKRTQSILNKLERFSDMQLSRVQDIGGCRAVVNTIDDVFELRKAIKQSRARHLLVNEKDYITHPKESGYRSVHLIYRYKSDRSQTYNGHLIEIQIRSQIQHSWATAVETVGTLLQQSLKSSEGPEDWLRFFALTGSAFAENEGTPLISDTPRNVNELRVQVTDMARQLNVESRLRSYGTALRHIRRPHMMGSTYYLLELHPSRGTLMITGYKKKELPIATLHYLVAEKKLAESPGAQAVLVAAESLRALRRAYPNYFGDTQVFIKQLNQWIEQPIS